MKKLFCFLILANFLVGCVTVNTKMNTTLNQVYPGMPTSAFKNKVPKSTLVQMTNNYVCYKLEQQSAKFGEPGGYVYSTRFFYFKDDKLYRIDEGTRATDLKIEIANDLKIH